MKKLFLFSFLLLTSSFLLNAQAPQGIPYQAIARNASGVAISNTAVKVRFSIRDSIATGAIKYQETHNPTTSALGLFSVNVGMGTVVSGTFSGINWGKNAKFLQVELNTTGGTTYTDMGTTQMMSVPYAIYSANSGNGMVGGTAQGQMMYWNGSEWMMVSPGSQGQNLTFCNGVPTWGPCPASNLPNVQTSPITSITSNGAAGGGLILSDGNGTVTSRGLCWGTTPNPTINNTKSDDCAEASNFGSYLSGLNPLTTYYVRSYATNSAGTTYGNQVVFSTAGQNGGDNLLDVEGNSYGTVTIGNQIWMRENLKVAKYRNGDQIPNLTNNRTAWLGATSGASSSPDNNADNERNFGKLYNGYTVTDSRGLCPAGWHTPTNHDWRILINYLDPNSDTTSPNGNSAGVKMKTTGSIQNFFPYLKTGWWTDPNCASNESGFSALPAGARNSSGYYDYQGILSYGSFWSSTSTCVTNLSYSNCSLYLEGGSNLKTGYSVRCLKD